MRTLCI